MTRYLICYVDKNGREGCCDHFHWPYSREDAPAVQCFGWNWYKTKQEAEYDADLMRKENFYRKVWVEKRYV